MNTKRDPITAPGMLQNYPDAQILVTKIAFGHHRKELMEPMKQNFLAILCGCGLGSTVASACFERVPFKFDGKIGKAQVLLK